MNMYLWQRNVMRSIAERNRVVSVRCVAAAWRARAWSSGGESIKRVVRGAFTRPFAGLPCRAAREACPEGEGNTV